MDDWIARLCNYRANRVSHLALLGMRDELERRRDTLGKQLEQCEAAIQAATAHAEQKAGMDVARRGLRELEERIAATKRRAGAINAQLAAYADCTDPRYVRARELVAKQLGEQSIDELVRKARATHTLADDELVSRLGDMYDRRTALQHERRALAQQREADEQKYERAKSLERELRMSPQFNSRGGFGGMDWSALFMGYMAGSLTSRDVERSLASHWQEPSSSTSNSFWQESSSSSDRSSDSGSDSFGTSDSSDSGSYSSSDSF
jgi:hypothetical protein